MKTITDKSIRALLKDAQADRPSLIYLVFRYDNGRFKTSTGLTVMPYLWDADKQEAITDPKKVRNKQEREANDTLNSHLRRQRSVLLKVLNTLQMAQIPFSNDAIKQHLDTALNRVKKEKPKPAPKPETFIDYIKRFVEEARAGKRLNAKDRLFADGTLNNYLKYRNILINYQTTTKRSLTNDSFTLTFYSQFKTYLVGEGHTLNYVGAVLSGIKQLLKQAHSDGLAVNTDFQKREFRKVEEEVDNVYLSEADLNALYQLDLSRNTKLDRVRDVFLIGCYTGLRFTNYTQLRPENITHGGRLLTVQAIKNGPKVSIPLNPNVVAILTKYNGELPRALSNQKFNNYIKELGRLAGLTQPVEKTRTEGGKRNTQTAQLWELITTHTARRSFATNAFLAGVPTVSIMKITGHKSEGQFLKYIKVSSEQNALLLLSHPHFGGTADNRTVPVIPLNKVA